MLTFIKNWTLPIAMLAGALGYFMFATIPFLEPAKPYVNQLVTVLTPSLIFAQLLLTFCKVNPHDLLPAHWHGWLLLLQLFFCFSMLALLLLGDLPLSYREVFEGAMVCFICPTATAAAVITGKLGGSVPALTTYTLLSNLLAAIAVPLLFPLVEPHEGLSFVAAFLKILSKVFPLLLCPFFVAWLIRLYLPRLHQLLLNMKDAAFYLWAVALAIVTAQTVRSLVQSEVSVGIEIMIALAGLVTCCIQFYLGKRIGPHHHRLLGRVVPAVQDDGACLCRAQRGRGQGQVLQGQRRRAAEPRFDVRYRLHPDARRRAGPPHADRHGRCAR